MKIKLLLMLLIIGILGKAEGFVLGESYNIPYERYDGKIFDASKENFMEVYTLPEEDEFTFWSLNRGIEPTKKYLEALIKTKNKNINIENVIKTEDGERLFFDSNGVVMYRQSDMEKVKKSNGLIETLKYAYVGNMTTETKAVFNNEILDTVNVSNLGVNGKTFENIFSGYDKTLNNHEYRIKKLEEEKINKENSNENNKKTEKSKIITNDSGVAAALALNGISQSQENGVGVIGFGFGKYGEGSAVALGYSRVGKNGKMIYKGGMTYDNSLKWGISTGITYIIK